MNTYKSVCSEQSRFPQNKNYMVKRSQNIFKNKLKDQNADQIIFREFYYNTVWPKKIHNLFLISFMISKSRVF